MADTKHVCDNCGWEGPEDQLEEIADFLERVQCPDDIVPSGECPKCGCLTFVEPSRWVSRGDYDNLLIVDVYGDRQVLRVFTNTPKVRDAIRRWQALDAQLVAGETEPDGWLPFSEFMETAGVEMFTTETVTLDALAGE